MLRPLMVFETNKDGTPDTSRPLPLDQQRPLTDEELHAAGHDKYRESEVTQEENMRLLRARAEVERNSLLAAADALAAGDKK